MLRHIISILMENEPGGLSRVIGLFAQRSYNIETLTVAPTEDDSISRVTITTKGDDRTIEQITKQLNKLIVVIKVVDLSEGEHIERELMLIKLQAKGHLRSDIKQTVEIFRGQIVDVTASTFVVQLTGTTDKLDAFIKAVEASTVLETVRTGVSGIARGERCMTL